MPLALPVGHVTDPCIFKKGPMRRVRGADVPTSKNAMGCGVGNSPLHTTHFSTGDSCRPSRPAYEEVFDDRIPSGNFTRFPVIPHCSSPHLAVAFPCSWHPASCTRDSRHIRRHSRDLPQRRKTFRRPIFLGRSMKHLLCCYHLATLINLPEGWDTRHVSSARRASSSSQKDLERTLPKGSSERTARPPPSIPFNRDMFHVAPHCVMFTSNKTLVYY